MAGIKILAAARALPSRIMTNEDLEGMVDTSDEWIVQRTGIRQRYIREKESADTLAAEAAEKAIEQAVRRDPAFDRSEIGVVIAATSTSEYTFPSIAAGMQKALSLRKDLTAFDVHAACSGFLCALQTARSILETGKETCALVIGSETMSDILDFKDRSTCVLFGDGAGALLIRKDSKGEFYTVSGTDSNKEVLYAGGRQDPWIHMKGQEVFRFAVSVIPRIIRELTEQADYAREDISYYICHQANARILEYVGKKYPDIQERIYQNVEKYGNTSAASIPIALADLMEEEPLPEGKKILLAAFGAGLTWNGILMTV